MELGSETKMKRKPFMLRIRKAGDKELKEMLVELQARKLLVEKRGGDATRGWSGVHPMEIKNLRKNIARVKTVLRERGSR